VSFHGTGGRPGCVRLTPNTSVSRTVLSTTLGFRPLDDSASNVTNPTKGYGLVDLFASYRYDENISGDIVVQNVFDRQYIQYQNSQASPGLTAKFGLTVKFASR